jgi:tRNA modification GTPase
LDEEAAIVSPVAGTTRDVLLRSVAYDGVPFTLVDMAGLRDTGGDAIEAIGIDRAREELARADCVLWLGLEGEGPDGAWEIEAQVDRPGHEAKSAPAYRLSAVTGEGVAELWQGLCAEARQAMGGLGGRALAKRQRELIAEAADALDECGEGRDLLVVGEHLRLARSAFDHLTGRAATEDMLDALFGRFCIGK